MKLYIKKETEVEKERKILWEAEHHVLEKTKPEERRAAELLV